MGSFPEPSGGALCECVCACRGGMWTKLRQFWGDDVCYHERNCNSLQLDPIRRSNKSFKKKNDTDKSENLSRTLHTLPRTTVLMMLMISTMPLSHSLLPSDAGASIFSTYVVAKIPSQKTTEDLCAPCEHDVISSHFLFLG